jgi:hypothetical protein
VPLRSDGSRWTEAEAKEEENEANEEEEEEEEDVYEMTMIHW